MKTLINPKVDRAELCNALLITIGDCGRRFFWHNPRAYGDKVSPPRYAFFSVDRGRVYFTDDYSQKRIYTHWTRDEWRGFSHGGTLRDLVIALRDFIRTGEPIKPGYLGPWPAYICDGDLWGYGADMAKVRQAAVEHGVVKPKDPTWYVKHHQALGAAA